MSEDDAWFQRFFGEEYLLFDEHPGTDREVAFIQKVMGLSPSHRLLDVGCGYGRHAIRLARQGIQVVGFDLSPTLLGEARNRQAAEARRQVKAGRTGRTPSRRHQGRVEGKEADAPGRMRLRWVRGDVRSLPFDGAFDRAISMFTSIGYFDDEAENFGVLKGIAGLLKRGGMVLIETVNRDAVIRHFQPVQVYRPHGLTVIEERQFDLVSGRSRVDVTVIRDGTETRLFHSIRVYAFTELEMLLMATGLRVEEVWGDFSGGPFTWNAASMIVLAKKDDPAARDL